ncbi:hypothetical protein [Paracidovorax wautersii]|uniref:Uncharacterized protein n=1 Tax=Paracidovorax wautersii TaxID=1177982 RepID=A0A1I1ZS01_9BURK|nr:hypothetical protein SAMN04489711_101289 [Paracidovorax wautersii]
MSTSHPTQQGTIQGEVTYREGDGMPMPIPQGPVELVHSHDSVTLSWTADNNAAGVAAMPRDEFDRFAREGKIQVEGEPVEAPEAPEPPQAEASASDAAPAAPAEQQAQAQAQPQAQQQQQQSAASADGSQPVPDPETSQDGHAVEHDYAEAAEANGGDAADAQPRDRAA